MNIKKPTDLIKINERTGQILYPTLLLKQKSGELLGNIGHYNNWSVNLKGNGIDEISFEVPKRYNDIVCPVWDDLTDFKIVQVGTYGCFETRVSFSESQTDVKTVTLQSLEVELGQVILRDAHFNDEFAMTAVDGSETTKINFDSDGNFIPTVLYSETDPQHSLLNRVLEKCPAWSIGTVTPYVVREEGAEPELTSKFQREFTVDGTDVYSFLTNDVAQEANVIFVFDSFNRKINVYSLYDCMVDGVQKAITVGEDTTILVSTKKLGNKIDITSNADNVKNCFYVTGGDDLINDMVGAVNVTGTKYIYQFSPQNLKDMPQSLVDKLLTYQKKLNSEREGYYGKDGIYTKLCDAYQQELYLRSTKMPNTEIKEAGTAKEQFEKVCAELKETIVGVFDTNSYNSTYFSGVTNNVVDMAQILMDSRFDVEVIDGTASYTCTEVKGQKPTNCKWTGILRFKRTSDAKDVYPVDSNDKYKITVNIDMDHTDNAKLYYADFKLKRLLAKSTMTGLDAAFDDSKATDEEIKTYFDQYSLERLKAFAQGYDNCVAELTKIKNTATDTDKTLGLYDKYQRRYQIVDGLREERQKQVDEQVKIIENLTVQQQKVWDELDLKSYLGEDDYKLYTTYIREGDYNNSNYISTGLEENYEKLMEKTRDLVDDATKELKKACVVQRTLSSDLNNLLVLDNFAKLHDKFCLYNFIRVRTDDELFKLRLMEISFSASDIAKINVTFSENILSIGDDASETVNDVANILAGMQSIATTYSSTMRQAKQGLEAKNTFTDIYQNGLNSAQMMLKNNDDNEVTITPSGILCRRMDDVGIYGEKQLRITGNMMAFTDDGWKTVKSAFGEMEVSDPITGQKSMKYGLITDALIGKLIVGERMWIGNEKGNVQITGDGITLDGAGITWKRDKNGQTGIGTNVIDGLDTQIANINEDINSTAERIDVEYRLSDSAKELKGDYKWTTSAPEWKDNTYMWSRQVVYYKNGKSEARNATCIAGASAKELSLNASKYAVAYNADNTLKDSTAITLTAIQENFDDAITWTTTPSVTLSGSGKTRTLAANAFNSNNQIIIKITAGTRSDTVTIVKIKDGAKGKDGEDGLPGGKGADGRTSYVHFAYATSADGKTGFSKTEFDGALYIGVRTDFVKEDSGIYIDYEWSKIKGDDGDDAYTIVLTNDNHTFSGTSKKVAIASATTCQIIAYKGTTQVKTNVMTLPVLPTGMTISVSNNGTTSTYFTVVISSSFATENGTVEIPIEVDGKSFKKKFTYSLSYDGAGVKSIVEEYAWNTDKTKAPTAGWSTTAPTWANGRYIWTRSKITYDDNRSPNPVTTTPYCDSSWEAANLVQKALDDYKQEIKTFNTEVDTRLDAAGVTEMDKDGKWIYSPKIASGYLYLSKGENYVEIDPLGLNNGNYFKIYANKNSIMTVNSSGATIAGWNINNEALYKDVGDYRTYIQAPTSSSTWVISSQKKINDSYYGQFILKADGTGKIGGWSFGNGLSYSNNDYEIELNPQYTQSSGSGYSKGLIYLYNKKHNNVALNILPDGTIYSEMDDDSYGNSMRLNANELWFGDNFGVRDRFSIMHNNTNAYFTIYPYSQDEDVSSFTFSSNTQDMFKLQSYISQAAGTTIQINEALFYCDIDGNNHNILNMKVLSDKRQKQNIKNMPHSYLTLLDILEPKTYEYIKYPNQKKIGFIAQEIEKALHVAHIDDNIIISKPDNSHTYYGVDYNEFIPILWQVCKDLKHRIEILEQKEN